MRGGIDDVDRLDLDDARRCAIVVAGDGLRPLPPAERHRDRPVGDARTRTRFENNTHQPRFPGLAFGLASGPPSQGWLTVTHGKHVQRRPPVLAGPVRHASHRRPHRRTARLRDDRRRTRKTFIESRDMFFLATCDADGHPQCSYKGGDPGFVRVVDDRTARLPRLRRQRHVPVARQHPAARRTSACCSSTSSSRTGCASTASRPVDEDDPLLAEFAGALLVVRVRTTQVFPNCGRYIHKMQLVERSTFVPRRRGGRAGPRLEADDVGAGVPAGRRSRAASGADRHERRSATDGDGEKCSGRRTSAGGPYSRRPEPTASARGATGRCGRYHKMYPLRARDVKRRPALHPRRCLIARIRRNLSGHRTGSPRPASRRRRRASPSPRSRARPGGTRHCVAPLQCGPQQ